MTYLPAWLPLDIVRDLGWTLIDFLWQGLLLATILHTILPMCGGARSRHNWAFGTLAAMVAAPVMTFLFIHSNASGNAALVVFPVTFARGIGVTTDVLAPTSTASAWISWLVVLWLAGIAVLSLRALGGWYLAETLRRRDTLALPTDLLQRCHAAQQRLGLARPVLFRQSHRVTVPVVVGWFRPVVLIPISVITGLAPQQLDALIMHELAHIRRLDAFINIMLIAAETILFYHPAIWWVTRQVRIEREHCCDDFGVSICGDASIYVEALTSLEAWKATPVRALASNGGSLKERVARLLGVPSRARGFSLSTTVGLAFLCFIVAAGIATAQNNATTSIQRFAIRVVDASVDKNARRGPPGEDRMRTSTADKSIPGALWLKREGQIVGAVLADAHAGAGRNGEPVVEFTLTPEGRDQFAALTRANIGHSLAVVVNGTIVTVPVVKEAMLDGKGEISGRLTEAQAGALAAEMMGTNPPASR
jgi:beta-lactamase regulating signal transducer with metallopeptidase domain